MDSVRLIADESIVRPDRGNEPGKARQARLMNLIGVELLLIPIAL